MKTLETKQLILRALTENDIDDLFNNWASDSLTMKYLSIGTHTTIDETKELFEKMKKKSDKRLEWGVELKENHQIIGLISAKKKYQDKCMELGYSISSKYWNQGIMTEGLKRVISYLLEEVDTQIIEAVIPSKNIASIKVAKKCGLELEASLKNRCIDKDGFKQDLLIYSYFK